MHMNGTREPVFYASSNVLLVSLFMLGVWKANWKMRLWVDSCSKNTCRGVVRGVGANQFHELKKSMFF